MDGRGGAGWGTCSVAVKGRAILSEMVNPLIFVGCLLLVLVVASMVDWSCRSEVFVPVRKTRRREWMIPRAPSWLV